MTNAQVDKQYNLTARGPWLNPNSELSETFYDELAMSSGPVVFVREIGQHGAYLVLRYKECVNAGKDHVTFNRHPAITSPDSVMYKYFTDPGEGRRDMLVPSKVIGALPPGPHHTLLRKLFAGAFGRDFLDPLRVKIEATCARLLPEMKRRGEFDVIKEYVYPMVRIAEEFLGVEPADYWRLNTWLFEAYNIWIMHDNYDYPYPIVNEYRSMAYELPEWAKRFIHYRKRFPRNDILSKAIEKLETGLDVTDAEFAQTMITYWNGAVQQLRLQLGNAVLALLRNPREMLELEGAPEIMPNAVEELLRFAPADQMLRRLVTTDNELGGVRLKKGDRVFIVTAAANRDPDVFPDPHRLWLKRPNAISHLAFGVGPTQCPAGSMARTIIGAMLTQTLPAMRDWHLKSTTFLGQGTIRGPYAAIVSW